MLQFPGPLYIIEPRPHRSPIVSITSGAAIRLLGPYVDIRSLCLAWLLASSFAKMAGSNLGIKSQIPGPFPAETVWGSRSSFGRNPAVLSREKWGPSPETSAHVVWGCRHGVSVPDSVQCLPGSGGSWVHRASPKADRSATWCSNLFPLSIYFPASSFYHNRSSN
jgi:hypothetical protein